MNKKIAVIKGDGIGPEIVEEAIKVLKKIEAKFNHDFTLTYVDAGGVAIDKYNVALPQETIDVCLASDSVILGAVGGPKYDSQPANNRPEKALLEIRKLLNLYANLRPAKLFSQLKDASPLKKEIVDAGIDFMVVRELTGGVYFGEHVSEVIDHEEVAYDIMKYSTTEIKRIAKVAFDSARLRNKKVCSVDKANVLDSSKLWRKVVNEVAKEYPDVKLEHMYVDNAAMQLCKNPSQFDVILTENMFGDILSDEASMISGTIGTIPSASFGDTTRGMYEPIHGSAPDIAGKDLANPIGTILSIAMMLKYSFQMEEEANMIEDAVAKVLDEGYRTKDMESANTILIGCKEMGERIANKIN